MHLNLPAHFDPPGCRLFKLLLITTLLVAGLNVDGIGKSKTIIVSEDTAPLEIFAANSLSPSFLVSGTIVADGEPLPGATVRVKGSDTGTVTDAMGKFELEVPDGGGTLVVSYIGFETSEVPVLEATNSLQIELIPSVLQMDELVVVGYGTEKKVNLTGSVSAVSAENLANRPITNIASALQGTMSGVTVTQNTGKPGEDRGTIRIRGIGTLNNSEAMVVVDGVVVSNMNTINYEDIESISVLKDAASASIYGSRAANGVILITTKSGKAGKVTAHYNTYIGKQTPTTLPDFLPSWQAASLYNEAAINEGGTARYTDMEIQKFKDGSDPDNYANTDWVDLLYNSGSGMQQSHFIDVSGGTEKTQAYFSLGYLNQEGIVKNMEDSRYTTTFKVSSRIGNRLKVSGNISYWLDRYEEPTNPYRPGIDEGYSGFNEYVGLTYRISNMIPNKYSNGHYGFVTSQGNPMAWLESGQQTKSSTNNLRAILDADLEIIKGLHFMPRLGYTTNFWQSKNFTNDIQYYDHVTGDPTFYSGPSRLSERTSSMYNVTLQSLLQYDKSIGRHDMSVLAGYSQEYLRESSVMAHRMEFLNHSIAELAASGPTGMTSNGNAGDLALRSYFGRINYSFDSRYLFEGNIRYDGSSRFRSDDRWGAFPSFSAGWRISEEDFFTGLSNVISELKFRGSWGMLGNQNIGSYYPTYETISATGASGSGYTYTFGGALAAGIGPYLGANTLITWEKVTATDLGLDAVLFDGMISLTADYFHKDTDDILMRIPVSAIYGQVVPYVNAAAVRNTGFEFGLGYHGTINDFKFNVNTNASFIKNSVRDLKETSFRPGEPGYTFWEVPYPINSYYGYQTEGLFKTQDEIDSHATQPGGSTAPGDIKYRDQLTVDTDGDGTADAVDGLINADDRVYLGTYFPKITYGLNLSMEWKGFDLSLFFQGAGGVKGFVRNEMFGELREGGIGKPTSAFLDRWTAEKPDSDFPRAWSENTQNSPNAYPSDFWIRNADYLRLKSLILGYTINSQFLKTAGIESVKIYYSGQNLLTLSKFYDWVDPEATSQGVDGGRLYPMVKTNTLGINLTF